MEGWLTILAAILGVAFFAGSIALALRLSARRRRRDVERVAAVSACFRELAARRGFRVEQPEAQHHPLIGELPIPPTVHGQDGPYAVSIAVATDAAVEQARLWTEVCVAREGAAWPETTDIHDHRPTMHAAASDALDRLLGSAPGARRVTIRAGRLVATPNVPETADWDGYIEALELGADRLERLLDATLRFARALDR